MTQKDEIKELREYNKRLSNQLFKSIKEIQRLNNELEKVKWNAHNVKDIAYHIIKTVWYAWDVEEKI